MEAGKTEWGISERERERGREKEREREREKERAVEGKERWSIGENWKWHLLKKETTGKDM